MNCPACSVVYKVANPHAFSCTEMKWCDGGWWCDDVMMINGPEQSPERSPERLHTKHYGSALIPRCRNEWPRQMRTSSGATEISDAQQNAECTPNSVKL